MTTSGKARARRQVGVGPADLRPGERRIVQVEGKSLGIFNVDGAYFALHNRCPHMAGNLCEGPVTGTTLPVDGPAFVYGMEGEIVRCAWHGWEFVIADGRCLSAPRLRARTYPVTVVDGQLYVGL